MDRERNSDEDIVELWREEGADAGTSVGKWGSFCQELGGLGLAPATCDLFLRRIQMFWSVFLQDQARPIGIYRSQPVFPE